VLCERFDCHKNAVFEFAASVFRAGNKFDDLANLDIVGQRNHDIGSTAPQARTNPGDLAFHAGFINVRQREFSSLDTPIEIIVPSICLKRKTHSIVDRAPSFVRRAVGRTLCLEKCWVHFAFEWVVLFGTGRIGIEWRRNAPSQV
jgi:hypothetical protein